MVVFAALALVSLYPIVSDPASTIKKLAGINQWILTPILLVLVFFRDNFLRIIWQIYGEYGGKPVLLFSLFAFVLLILYALGLPAWVALLLTIALMALLALGIERIVLRPLVGQPDAILLMATIGLTLFLQGAGETIFGGEPQSMISTELGLPTGTTDWEVFEGRVTFQHIDIAAIVIAGLMVAGLALFFSKTRVGRALRAVADDHQAALSVGISLNQIWVIVWFAAGIVALVTGIMWGARSDVSFALEVIALKALAVLILGGFTSIPGAIVGGLIVGIGEKVFEVYWGGLLGGGTEAWFAYVLALIFLLFRPQGLFGEKIIERV